MLIQIESGGKDGPRKVVVTEDGMEPVEFTAASLPEAHKTLKKGRVEGWDAVRPATLARQTKEATKVENARIDAGKKAAEPKVK